MYKRYVYRHVPTRLWYCMYKIETYKDDGRVREVYKTTLRPRSVCDWWMELSKGFGHVPGKGLKADPYKEIWWGELVIEWRIFQPLNQRWRESWSWKCSATTSIASWRAVTVVLWAVGYLLCGGSERVKMVWRNFRKVGFFSMIEVLTVLYWDSFSMTWEGLK